MVAGVVSTCFCACACAVPACAMCACSRRRHRLPSSSFRWPRQNTTAARSRSLAIILALLRIRALALPLMLAHGVVWRNGGPHALAQRGLFSSCPFAHFRQTCPPRASLTSTPLQFDGGGPRNMAAPLPTLGDVESRVRRPVALRDRSRHAAGHHAPGVVLLSMPRPEDADEDNEEEDEDDEEEEEEEQEEEQDDEVASLDALPLSNEPGSLTEGDVTIAADRATSNDIFTCSVCGRWFDRLRTLQAHQQTHSGAFQCRYCHRGWPNGNKLRRHEAVHMGKAGAIVCLDRCP